MNLVRIKLISDLDGLGSVRHEGLDIELLKYTEKGNKLLKIIKYFCISFSYDYFLLNFSNDIFILGLLKLFFPFNPCKFITLDIFLPYPEPSIQGKIKKWIKIIALKSINLIFIYSKRNERLCKAYKIDPKKVVYIPFKINSYDYVVNHKISDGGYIFSGGRSRRDFQTLITAGKDLQYPFKIVAPHEEELKMQGTLIDSHALPSNIELIHDDGSIKSFVSYIANSKLVVLPLKSQDFASTGTSVYLLCRLRILKL